MDFKFEAGNYYLAGRETLEGHDVLRIEYYPTRMFDDTTTASATIRKAEERRQEVHASATARPRKRSTGR